MAQVVQPGGDGGSTTATNQLNFKLGTIAAYKTLTPAKGTIYFAEDTNSTHIYLNGKNIIPKLLDVAHGGTGKTTLTSGQALIGNGTGAVSLRAITNNTSTTTTLAASTNLITANTLYYYKGNSNITTVGTITSGTWQGSTVGMAYGGTGRNSYVANKILYSSSATSIGIGHYMSSTQVTFGSSASTPASGITCQVNGGFSLDGKIKFSYNDTHKQLTIAPVTATDNVGSLVIDLDNKTITGDFSIDKATTAGTANSVIWGNITSKPASFKPSSHAASSDSYGAGSGSNYGHVKLSDATSSTSGTGSGVAATPKAVTAAYSLASDAYDYADDAYQEARYASHLAARKLSGTYGTTDPTSSTPGYGTNGTLYFKIITS